LPPSKSFSLNSAFSSSQAQTPKSSLAEIESTPKLPQAKRPSVRSATIFGELDRLLNKKLFETKQGPIKPPATDIKQRHTSPDKRLIELYRQQQDEKQSQQSENFNDTKNTTSGQLNFNQILLETQLKRPRRSSASEATVTTHPSHGRRYSFSNIQLPRSKTTTPTSTGNKGAKAFPFPSSATPISTTPSQPSSAKNKLYSTITSGTSSQALKNTKEDEIVLLN